MSALAQVVTRRRLDGKPINVPVLIKRVDAMLNHQAHWPNFQTNRTRGTSDIGYNVGGNITNELTGPKQRKSILFEVF